LCSPILHCSSPQKYFFLADDTSFYTSTLDCCVTEAVDVDDYVRILCNPTGGSKGKCMASDDGNGVGGVSNYVVIDKKKRVEGDECVVEVKECEESELIDKRVSSLDAAFKVYNEYAFRKGFSIRCDKLQRRESSQEVCSRKFYCSKQGIKSCLGKQDKTFTKWSRMCNCKAKAIFYIEPNGE